jgi:hypothetical protein
MQEKQQLRPAGSYDSACCLCVPRLLFLSPDGTRLLQEPLPELAALRQQHNAWHIGSTAGKASSLTTAAGGSGGGDAFEAPLALQPGVPLQLGSSSSSSHVDLELTLQRGEAESVVLLLQPFEGLPGAAGAGIAYCWATDTLQVGVHSCCNPASLIMFVADEHCGIANVGSAAWHTGVMTVRRMLMLCGECDALHVGRVTMSNGMRPPK